MKKLITLTAIALPLAFSARAQWIVYDPTVNIEQIVSEAENIAEYVDMVDNQVQQITAARRPASAVAAIQQGVRRPVADSQCHRRFRVDIGFDADTARPDHFGG